MLKESGNIRSRKKLILPDTQNKRTSVADGNQTVKIFLHDNNSITTLKQTECINARGNEVKVLGHLELDEVGNYLRITFGL